jgi:hypothetical protein
MTYPTIEVGPDLPGVGGHRVRANPTQDWLARQITGAFPWDTTPHYLQRDWDKSYGLAFRHSVRAMEITDVITAPRSPWLTPMLSVSSARSAENVWITSSSLTSALGTATAFLAHDAAPLINGETLYIDGGYHIID